MSIVLPTYNEAETIREFLRIAEEEFARCEMVRVIERASRHGLGASVLEGLQQLPYDRILWGYGDYFFRPLCFALRVPLRIAEMPA
ncbi:MAG: hypothetical protein ACREJ6_03205 [Candidatus Methylomirabilis sp.]